MYISAPSKSELFCSPISHNLPAAVEQFVPRPSVSSFFILFLLMRLITSSTLNQGVKNPHRITFTLSKHITVVLEALEVISLFSTVLICDGNYTPLSKVTQCQKLSKPKKNTHNAACLLVTLQWVSSMHKKEHLSSFLPHSLCFSSISWRLMLIALLFLHSL